MIQGSTWVCFRLSYNFENELPALQVAPAAAASRLGEYGKKSHAAGEGIVLLVLIRPIYLPVLSCRCVQFCYKLR